MIWLIVGGLLVAGGVLVAIGWFTFVLLSEIAQEFDESEDADDR